MELRRQTPGRKQMLTGYGDRGFRISGTEYQGAVLVTPEETRTVAAVTVGDLALEMVAWLAEIRPAIELLLLGWGKTPAQPTAALVAALSGLGIMVEAMDSGAAARTYNVLMMEDRRVAALLLPIG